MQVCISFQTDNHASTPPLKFFTGRMPFLPPNQQRQSTEGTVDEVDWKMKVKLGNQSGAHFGEKKLGHSDAELISVWCGHHIYSTYSTT